eukprot:516836_1
MTEGGSTSLDGDPRSNGDDDSWWLQFRRGEASLQDHPVYPSFVAVGKRAALYAAGGSLCGATYAYWWGHNVPHYAASLGANYGWLGLAFHAIEFAGAKYVDIEHGTIGTHVTAGCITGAFAGGAFGGPPTAVKGAMAFAFLGMGVYGIRRGWNWQYEKWRTERMEELGGNREKNVYFEGWRKSDDKLPGQHFGIGSMRSGERNEWRSWEGTGKRMYILRAGEKVMTNFQDNIL